HEVRLADWDADAPQPEVPADSRKPALLVPLCGANYVKPKAKRPDKPKTPAMADAKPVAGAPGSSRIVTPESRPLTNGTPDPTMNGSTTHAVNHTPTSPALEGTALAQALHLTRDSLTALQRMQDQTAQLHRQFLDGQDVAQRTVQFLVEQQQRLLQASIGLPVGPAPVLAPLPIPTRAEPPVLPSIPVPVALTPPAPVVVTPSAPPPVAANSNQRIETVLLEVIAEKTGYPTEMLELDMALDADLGIDSIKRVEILSALQERLPEAPVIKPEHLGTLHNLRQIAAFLTGQNAAAPPAPAIASAQDGEKITAVLLEVIAEKTGYPTEMLELDMAL